jgi:hypothetical protein
MTDPSILKVFGPKYWTDDLFITGNRKGLETLKKAIEKALENNGRTIDSDELMETDGYSYVACVKMHDGDLLDETWMNLPLHYEDGESLTPEERDLLDKFISDDTSMQV